MSQTEEIVYIVDDDQSVREALEDLFASVNLSVQSFESVHAFEAAEKHDGPSCLLLDVRMPGQSGMEYHRQQIESGNNLSVVFITGHGDISMGVQAMKNGAIEFLTKPFREQELLDAIYLALEKDKLRKQQNTLRQHLETRWASLSKGEQAVASLVAEGLLNKQIASQLTISEITVKVRRSHVMRKMEAKNIADFIRIMERLFG